MICRDFSKAGGPSSVGAEHMFRLNLKRSETLNHHHQTLKELGHSLTRSGLVVEESLHWSSPVSSS
jgi:hypothetical protein